MKLTTLLATGALLCATSQALAMSAVQEKQFLDDQHVKDRVATIQTPQHSWVTTQGGNTDKACDSGPSINANQMTQVSSDNDGNNGNPGLWELTGNGYVTLLNPGRKPALCSADEFFGDQTQEGAYLGNYYHNMPIQWLLIWPGTSQQIVWHLLSTIPLLPDHVGDYMAYWIYVTCSQPVQCKANGYDTLEFGNGQ